MRLMAGQTVDRQSTPSASPILPCPALPAVIKNFTKTINTVTGSKGVRERERGRGQHFKALTNCSRIHLKPQRGLPASPPRSGHKMQSINQTCSRNNNKYKQQAGRRGMEGGGWSRELKLQPQINLCWVKYMAII